MIIAPLNPREAALLAGLRALPLVAAAREPEFDGLTEAARAVLGGTAAAILLLGPKGEMYRKAWSGPPQPAAEALALALGTAACAGCAVPGEPEPADGLALVLREPGGAPLGALCVLAEAGLRPTPQQRSALDALADVAATLLLQRRRLMMAENRLYLYSVSFDGLLESLPEGVAVLNDQGGLALVNDRFFVLSGLSKSRLLSRSAPGTAVLRWLGGLGALGEEKCALRRWRAVRETGQPLGWQGEVANNTWLAVRILPVEGGGHAIILRDITDEVLAEREARALRAMNAQLRSAVEAASCGVLLLEGPPGSPRLLWANPAFTAITGFTAEELRRRGVRALLRPASLAGGLRPLAEAMRHGRGGVSELAARRKDGSACWLRTHVAPVPAAPEGDSAPRWVVVQSDTTDFHALVLAQEAARRGAEEASRAKSEFLATVSHEVRTPLNGVSGMAALLLETPLTPLQRRYAQVAQQSAGLLLSVVNDLLDSTRLEAGRLELERIPFMLEEVVEDMLDLLSPAAQEKGIELALDLPPGLHGRRLGDPTRFSQVLLNLLGNAVKFTAQGSVVVSLREEEDQRLLLRVADTGPGLDARSVARMFERFAQGDSSVARLYGGSGLGLPIARQLVELMGGQIGVETTPGAGSTFWCRIPLPRAEAPPTLPRSRPGASLLLVEPPGPGRALLAERLRELGLAVTVCCPGAEWPREARFDRVMADLSVPAARLPREVPRIRLCVAGQPGERGCFNLARPVRYGALLRALEPLLVLEGAQGMAAPQPPPRMKLLGHVLLAEDNGVNREIVRLHLQASGLRVTEAWEGGQAVAAAMAERFDLILMDLEMPGMDGPEAIRRIRALGGHNATVPIMALTAHGREAALALLASCGVEHYLTKPVGAGDLLARIAQLMALPSR
ncbi:ATP-binding protein [Teichococcus aestuarii]|uniref:ATP-binding protein n=1 Tax=Teichococcus aestuarii TaxID=568898 RepID=UPI00360C76CC